MARALRSIIDKWDLMKLRSFLKAKDTVNRTEEYPTDWEKISSNVPSDTELIFKIYKEFKKLYSKKSNNQLKEGYRPKQRILNRRILNVQEALKEIFNILSHGDMQIKMTLKFKLISIKTKIEN